MRHTLQSHIVYLEKTIQELRNRLTSSRLTTDDLQDIELQLALSQSALTHYQQAFALESSVAGNAGNEPPAGNGPAAGPGANGGAGGKDSAGAEKKKGPGSSGSRARKRRARRGRIAGYGEVCTRPVRLSSR